MLDTFCVSFMKHTIVVVDKLHHVSYILTNMLDNSYLDPHDKDGNFVASDQAQRIIEVD